MGFIPPPQLARDRPSYLETYNKIISTHRRSPLTSASSVILLVAPNVDALCASRMLATLFKHDDVAYRIIPVSGQGELEVLATDLKSYTELHTLILLNIAGRFDLTDPMWFGEYDTRVTIHVIDSCRPQSLANLFTSGENGERVVVWDDGEVENLTEEKKAWEALQYDIVVDSDDDDSGDDSEEEFSEDGAEPSTSEVGSPSTKRKRSSDKVSRKRPRLEKNETRISRDDYEVYEALMNKHYGAGLWHGQSASGTIYILSTLLERVDIDLLWLAILGLTFQYLTARISRDTYEKYHAVYYDEVSRLNPRPINDEPSSSVDPNDISVRATEELRFMLFRHWTLYDAMFHSSYVASKLGIWKERGRQRLTGLLAKMGFSIPQTQQPYPHMDMDLKRTLVQKLNDVAPEYGLVELSYPSFVRCFGFHSQPLSAADAVEALSTLLDVAEGIRMEVEAEGMRNGGEWFGGGRVWDAHRSDKHSDTNKPKASDKGARREDGADEDEEPAEPRWWVNNFWRAYDACNNIGSLREALGLSMTLQRAIIRQGTSIIDKQDIRTMRNHRVVILSQGPDLALFSNPSVLMRLALWLVDALRDKLSGMTVNARSRKKSLPFILACLNETKGRYTVVGVMGALDYGEIRKNEFMKAFLDAQEKTRADVQLTSFDGSILEIDQADLKIFLEKLCES
ncbi:hypothetical protein CVT24_010528 [Panaeolus cyanescens]|uniref:CDC45-like protein n=1 Tax=Panaeolus cyanescens TaxID=181874 RepID=A0A409YYH3_9AGAR|nr:hypothetical protein CVT24_010528 [Panaeolus cyanescens]